MAVVVSESEIGQEHDELAAQSIFVEPTSATIAAALKKVSKETIPASELIVGVLTGHGLKNPPKV